MARVYCDIGQPGEPSASCRHTPRIHPAAVRHLDLVTDDGDKLLDGEFGCGGSDGLAASIPKYLVALRCLCLGQAGVLRSDCSIINR